MKRRCLALGVLGLSLAAGCSFGTEPHNSSLSGDPKPTPEPTAPPSSSRENDVAVMVGAGDIAASDSTGDEATAALLDAIPGTIFTLGDNAYLTGTQTNFETAYANSWGRHKARTRPAAGNHEYYTPAAAPYFDYFSSAAGDRDKGYYSFTVSRHWHALVLNSNGQEIGGLGPDSPQYRWAEADLKANSGKHILAYWHHPRFNSGEHGGNAAMQDLWALLYRYGVEIVMAGHEHVYERFAPMDADGQRDDAKGIRSFIVGTGGKKANEFRKPLPTSEARETRIVGVLKLTLQPHAYAWEFLAEPGTPFTDTGSASCRPLME